MILCSLFSLSPRQQFLQYVYTTKGDIQKVKVVQNYGYFRWISNQDASVINWATGSMAHAIGHTNNTYTIKMQNQMAEWVEWFTIFDPFVW